jgi:hypothetical protein
MADAPMSHTTQYFEMVSNRGIYHEGWYANTTPPVPPWMLNAPMPDVNDYKWELYNLTKDYTQFNDLSAQMPDKLKEMQALFLQQAKKFNVLPLDNRQFARAITSRPSPIAGLTVFNYSGGLSGISPGSAPNILNRSFTITAEVDVPAGGNGMLVTDGGRFGGYGLYLRRGRPVFTYNFLDLERFQWKGRQTIPAGKHTIEFDFSYDGPGVAKGGTGVLKVDGQQAATLKIPHTTAFLFPIGETFDIGVDTRTPVDDDYQLPFRFNGKIDKLTVKLGPVRLTEAEHKRIQLAFANATD